MVQDQVQQMEVQQQAQGQVKVPDQQTEVPQQALDLVLAPAQLQEIL